MTTALLSVSVLGNVILMILFLWALVLYREGKRYIEVVWDDGDDPRIQRPRFRRFVGDRHEDVTGISGEGIRVEGVVFSDGWGITHWLDMPPMSEPKTEVWHKPWWRRGPDPFTKISGHGGKTKVVWLDSA